MRTLVFNGIRKCGEEETQNQIEFLSNTPVAQLAELLREGKCILKKALICSLQQLGGLKTEFGQIGPLVPSARSGAIKFRVSELVPTLRSNLHVADNGLLERIEAIMEKEAENAIPFNITVLLLNGEAIVKDGNKRTIAFFENRREQNIDEIHYEVFLIQPV